MLKKADEDTPEKNFERMISEVTVETGVELSMGGQVLKEN
jgi:hypothetical protein